MERTFRKAGEELSSEIRQSLPPTSPLMFTMARAGSTRTKERMMDIESHYEDADSLIPKEMTTYYLGLLRRGAKWTPEVTEETERVQETHLAYIRNMFEAGDLLVAGPFTDDGELRGVFLFRTATLEEAQALAEDDPAVKAGRLIVDIHPWMVPAGVFPR